LLNPIQQRFGFRQKLLDGRANDLEFGLKPARPSGEPMMLETQKRPYRQPM
jgi:hypothetical protein